MFSFVSERENPVDQVEKNQVNSAYQFSPLYSWNWVSLALHKNDVLQLFLHLLAVSEWVSD